MLIVIMGPCGCGKSTVGSLLAQKLGWAFVEGDQLHSDANIGKMSQGIALTDQDRLPWLCSVGAVLKPYSCAVLSCSALKRSYRSILTGLVRADCRMVFVRLDVGRAVLEYRLEQRIGHFMPSSLIDSQLEDLQPFDASEDFLIMDATLVPQQIVEEIINRLSLVL